MIAGRNKIVSIDFFASVTIPFCKRIIYLTVFFVIILFESLNLHTHINIYNK